MTTPTDRSDPPAFAFFNEVAIIEQLARNRLERILPDGLLAPHFAVLNHLVRLGDGRTPTDLARAFQLAKGAMTNTLQRLEARGLVELSPDPRDGRAKRVRLTEAGRGAREACIKALGPFLAELERDGLAAEEFAAALPFLRRVRARLDRARDADRGAEPTHRQETVAQG